MQDQIIEFTNVLRRNGVRVSLSENIDAFRAIDLLGIEDSSQFRAALRTTLVKRAIDLRPFDELFDLFFLGIGRSLNQADQQLMEQLGLSPQEFQELLDRIDTAVQERTQFRGQLVPPAEVHEPAHSTRERQGLNVSYAVSPEDRRTRRGDTE